MDFKKTNIAVLKSMFLQMDKTTFVRNAKDLKKEILNVDYNMHTANYRFALINLYKWLKAVYKVLAL